MTRLFVTLYALILIAEFGLIFSTNPILSVLLDKAQLQYTKNNFGGVFVLLDEQLALTTDSQAKLTELNAKFGFDLQLMPISEFSPTEKEASSLQNYGITVRELDGADFVYSRSQVKPNYIWSLQIDPTQSDMNHDLVIGPARLFEKKLQHFPESEWQTHLLEIQSSFGIPLTLLDRSALEIQSLTQQTQQALNNKRVIGFDIDEQNERYFYRLADSDKILKIGPVSLPAFIPYLMPIVCGFIAILFASVIFLWMRPLWSNLSSLDSAAMAFGRGDFSARANLSRFSPIKPLSANFNQMAARVQSLISSHKDLTNAVSHEIRTPLARMRFGLEMLENAENSEDKKRFANEMAIDIEELDSLVGELLTYARFERSEPNIKMTEHVIIPWLAAQVSRAQKLSEEVVITFHHQGVADNQTGYFEGRLLARALSNLLRNALQYADKQVQMSIKQTEHEFWLSVEDDGVGIPEKDRETLFDPFTRVDESRSRDTGGFGIGLAIVRQITDWHHASIAIEDSQLGGAKFVMKIPKN